ncbi:MAG: hypothetical protein GY904_18715 [Planctomycetaceae bacterium]|nr:hypothetical protein [Planctomycetaceae bacterium]
MPELWNGQRTHGSLLRVILCDQTWSQNLGYAKRRLRQWFPAMQPTQRQLEKRYPWSFKRHLPAPSTLPSAPVPIATQANLERGIFVCMNQAVSLGRPVDWSAKSQTTLWQYALHEFGWMWQLAEKSDGWDVAKGLIHEWVDANPCTADAHSWDPRTIALRLLNWQVLIFNHWRSDAQADPIFWRRMTASFLEQWRWLRDNIEWHLGANHLLENLAAIYYAMGLFRPTPKTNRERRRIERWLIAEFRRQFLSDGMHYERSAMYHLRMHWVMELIKELPSEPAKQEIQELVAQSKQAICCLLHPSGQPSLLNDSVSGIFSIPLDINPQQLPQGPWSLPDAGYYGMRGDDEYLAIDAAPLGPKSQPAHAHADFFTCEWTVGGLEALTDTGVFCYEAGDSRLWDRSTPAHNTLAIDNGNSAPVLGSFQVMGRKKKPRILNWHHQDKHLDLEAEHFGYAGVSHRRRWRHSPAKLTIDDWVFARRPVQATSHWHLGPSWKFCHLDGDRVRLVCKDHRLEVTATGPGSWTVARSRYSPQMGLSIERIWLQRDWGTAERLHGSTTWMFH